jgi:ABC-type Fe3+/spermidine/putrescine transport system ATPase subunit
MSVYDNVAFPLRQHTDTTEEEIAPIVMRRLEDVGLAGAATLMPNQLSGGMHKRAGFARRLCSTRGSSCSTNPIRASGCSHEIRPVRVTLVRSGRHAGVTQIGVEQPHSARLATADADLPSLSDGHLVADATTSRNERSARLVDGSSGCGTKGPPVKRASRTAP